MVAPVEKNVGRLTCPLSWRTHAGLMAGWHSALAGAQWGRRPIERVERRHMHSSNDRRDDQPSRQPRPTDLRIVDPTTAAGRWWVRERPTAPPLARTDETTVERAARAIERAGFRPLSIEGGPPARAARAGFVLRSRHDGCAEIRWVGPREVGSWPRRRTCLTGYAGILRLAGLAVQYVADESEPYLVCRHTPHAAGLRRCKDT